MLIVLKKIVGCVILSLNCIVATNSNMSDDLANREEAYSAMLYIEDKYNFIPDEIHDNGESFYNLTYNKKEFDVYFDGELWYDNYQADEVKSIFEDSIEKNLIMSIDYCKLNYGKFYSWDEDDKYYGLVNKKCTDMSLVEVLNEGYNSAKIIIDKDTSVIPQYNISGLYGGENVDYVFLHSKNNKQYLYDYLHLDLNNLLVYVNDYARVVNDISESYIVVKNKYGGLVYCYPRIDSQVFDLCEITKVGKNKYKIDSDVQEVSIYTNKNKKTSLGKYTNIRNYNVTIFSGNSKKFKIKKIN